MLAYRRARARRRRRPLPVAHRPAARRRTCCRAAAPLVLTAHDVLPREPRPGQLAAQRRLYERVDAVVVHSEHGARAAASRRSASTRRRSTSSRTARFDHLPTLAPRAAAARARPTPARRSSCSSACCARTRASTCCSRRGAGSTDAELWVVGMPRMDVAPLRARRAAQRALRAALRRRRRGRRAASAAPTSSCCPTARSTSPACCSPRWRSARRSCSATSAASPRSPRAVRALAAPGDADALRAALRTLLGDPTRRARMARRRARRGGRPTYSWERDRRAPRPRAATARLLAVEARRSSGSRPALLVYTQAGYGAAARRRSRGLRPRARAAARRRACRASALIVAAYDEEAVIAGEGRQRARARLPARAARGDRRLRRLAPTPPPSARARPAPTSCSSCRAAARSARRTRPSTRPAARSSPSPTPTRRWEPDALRELVGAFADPRVGYVCGQVRFVSARAATNQEGLYWRYEMALRGAGVARWPRSPRGNGAIYATRRDAYIVVDPIMGHDLSFPFNMVKRGLARRLRARRARDARRWSRSIEGEFARKRRMMSHAWPIVAARRHALDPRGYGAALRADDRLAPRAALRHARSCTCSRSRPTPRCSARAPLYAVALALAARAARRRAAAGAVRARPLLVARYYVLTPRRSPPGLWDWLRHGTEAGWDAAEGTR